MRVLVSPACGWWSPGVARLRDAFDREVSLLHPACGAGWESAQISPLSDNQSAFLRQMKSRQVQERLRSEESAPR